MSYEPQGPLVYLRVRRLHQDRDLSAFPLPFFLLCPLWRFSRPHRQFLLGSDNIWETIHKQLLVNKMFLSKHFHGKSDVPSLYICDLSDTSVCTTPIASRDLANRSSVSRSYRDTHNFFSNEPMRSILA